jgi:alkylated DNA repair dioxygenase AlkB
MLFGDSNLLPIAGEVYLYPTFFEKEESDEFFEKLKKESNWKQEGMKMYGKELLFPRLTAWYADEGKTYTYSGLKNTPEPIPLFLKQIKETCETKAGIVFNSVLLNYYRSGNDSMGWHADNEAELGKNPVIASLTFGASRKFQFKHRTVPNSIQNVILHHGSLLIMRGETQHNWLHQLPKVKENGERINITFRAIL